ncbi:Acetyltransferase, including N-acetylases of ribosomal protein [Methanocella conradii HZ254]|uniref:Acetyltransferase, including N-acetylases of ribosomal protein n=1 Tax=Methanocella conradii (strain DSM 24694 / JCM 17849 / CGMCC 1.5162 / HZ254) TaxID=1041930 RepID=H8I715_METCZ|nr:GNAT family protein [Methanocella conradii]AFC99845.1 Acetyltransferase, including N-acetylases of ribosomal protein [Methanocella conradii HZ254]MDI6896438.1 GNAT family protein [Methanocella conradii]
MMEHGTFHLDVGDGLHVRLLDERDAPALFALIDADREGLRKWLPWVDRTRTTEDSAAFIRNALEQYRNCTGLHAGIWQGSRLAGVIGYVNMDVNNRRAMIGYWLATPYRGKGLATRACMAMIDVAFNKLLFNKVEIYCAVDNHRSRAIPERLGFKPEGVLRQYERVNDHYVDVVAYGMLACEWREIRKKLKGG